MWYFKKSDKGDLSYQTDFKANFRVELERSPKLLKASVNLVINVIFFNLYLHSLLLEIRNCNNENIKVQMKILDAWNNHRGYLVEPQGAS